MFRNIWLRAKSIKAKLWSIGGDLLNGIWNGASDYCYKQSERHAVELHAAQQTVNDSSFRRKLTDDIALLLTKSGVEEIGNKNRFGDKLVVQHHLKNEGDERWKDVKYGFAYIPDEEVSDRWYRTYKFHRVWEKTNFFNAIIYGLVGTKAWDELDDVRRHLDNEANEIIEAERRRELEEAAEEEEARTPNKTQEALDNLQEKLASLEAALAEGRTIVREDAEGNEEVIASPDDEEEEDLSEEEEEIYSEFVKENPEATVELLRIRLSDGITVEEAEALKGSITEREIEVPADFFDEIDEAVVIEEEVKEEVDAEIATAVEAEAEAEAEEPTTEEASAN